MRRYRILEEDLRLIRAENYSLQEELEAPILQEMASLWWDLSEIERDTLDQEGPTCWPEKIDKKDKGIGLDRDTLADGFSGPVREMKP